MNMIQATWKNGQIVPDQDVDWPEGERLLIAPMKQEESMGLREEDWPDSPEGKAEWLRWYESLEPLLFTPEEEAQWHAALQEQRRFDKARLESGHIDGLFS